MAETNITDAFEQIEQSLDRVRRRISEGRQVSDVAAMAQRYEIINACIRSTFGDFGEGGVKAAQAVTDAFENIERASDRSLRLGISPKHPPRFKREAS